MNPQVILVPVDFTPTSDAALEAATMLARGSAGKLLIVHAREPRSPIDEVGYFYAYEHDLLEEELRHKLRSVVPPGGGVRYEHRLLEGTPVDAILNAADTEKVDIIVLGTHGRRGVGRWVMGSVAEAVVRRAKCPVLAVKSNPAAHVLTS